MTSLKLFNHYSCACVSLVLMTNLKTDRKENRETERMIYRKYDLEYLLKTRHGATSLRMHTHRTFEH
jgi:hypothetical protein